MLPTIGDADCEPSLSNSIARTKAPLPFLLRPVFRCSDEHLNGRWPSSLPKRHHHKRAGCVRGSDIRVISYSGCPVACGSVYFRGGIMNYAALDSGCASVISTIGKRKPFKIQPLNTKRATIKRGRGKLTKL